MIGINAENASRLNGRILFVHNDQANFVRTDLALLRKYFVVTDLYLPSRCINPVAIALAVARHDIIVGWFASWHTVLPMLLARLFEKPSMLIVGGYDLANMPEIGYGHQRGGLKKWISRLAMHMATCLVTNAYYSQAEAEKNAGISRERLRVVHHGVEDPFRTLPPAPRSRIALTVGNIDQSNLWRKGHEPFVRAAALLPDVKFVLVGAWKDDAIGHLRAIATQNVEFTGRVSDAVLLDYYQRASVYVQASAHEGFGLSLAEAMLAGCVPVVTRAGAIPEVVCSNGIYIDIATPDELAAAIRQGLDAEPSVRASARARIKQAFPLEQRGIELANVINWLLNIR